MMSATSVIRASSNRQCVRNEYSGADTLLSVPYAERLELTAELSFGNFADPVSGYGTIPCDEDVHRQADETVRPADGAIVVKGHAIRQMVLRSELFRFLRWFELINAYHDYIVPGVFFRQLPNVRHFLFARSTPRCKEVEIDGAPAQCLQR